MSKGPLNGIRVVELESIGPGPFSTTSPLVVITMNSSSEDACDNVFSDAL